MSGAAPHPPEPLSPLLTDPVGRGLRRMTIPMVWGLIAVLSISVVDTYFIGHLGPLQLAAMGFAFPIIMTLTSLAIGLGIGATSVISRAIGQGDRAQVRRLTTDSLTLSVTIVAVLCALGLVTIDPLFRAMGAGPEVLVHIRAYMSIWYLGMPFLVVPMVGNAALRAAGNARLPSLLMTLSAAINIVLDPLLIFGVGPFPRLEMEGAAIASICARAVTLVAALVVLGGRLRMIAWCRPPMRAMVQSWGRVLYIGLPAAGSQVIIPMSAGVLTALLAQWGPETVAGFGVATRIEALVMVVPMALSAGLGPIVGQNWGAGLRQRVVRTTWLAILTSLGFGLIAAAVLAVSAGVLVNQFTDSPAAIEVARTYLLVVPITYGFWGIAMVTAATFNAIGRPVPATGLVLLRMVVLALPLAWIGAVLAGPVGLFGGIAAANGCAGLVAWVWNRRACGGVGACPRAVEAEPEKVAAIAPA